MSIERKVISLACPVCGNEMIQDGKIKLKCDICGAIRGKSLGDYQSVIVDPAPISKEVLEKSFPPIDVPTEFEDIPHQYCSNIAQYVITASEEEDAFIFEHISQYCNGVLAHEGITRIPKRLLARALICFKEEHKEEWAVLMGIKEK